MYGKIKSAYQKFSNGYANSEALYVDSNYKGLGSESAFKDTFEKKGSWTWFSSIYNWCIA